MSFNLNPHREAELRQIIASYPHPRAAVLPALFFVQDELGYISDEAVEYVARALDVPVIDVHGVVSFYTMFNRRPIGRHHIQVCTNICCWLKGSEKLLTHIKEHLGIDVGETTSDGMFTLTTVECLGACGGAPMMQVDTEYYENLTEERIEEILVKIEGQK